MYHKNLHDLTGKHFDNLSDFSKFLEDMGEVPKGLSIERIDNVRKKHKCNCIKRSMT